MQATQEPHLEINEQFHLAAEYVLHTGCHLFLTGRAGTGKTTFLRHIKSVSRKRMAVVAPTGVAAINAGGTTIHSFFQIPPGLFVPSAAATLVPAHALVHDRLVTEYELNRNHKISADRLKVLRRLELLVIDEISMVRADLLDAIDATLRHARRNQTPFGGVQLLLIGDLFQLPPVTRDGEESLLSQFYESPYFFSALVLKRQSLLFLELKTIYRQKEARFIELLNGVRNSTILPHELNELNSRYQPHAEVPEGVITLTSHNAKSDAINQTHLKALKAPMLRFKATVTGEFSPGSMPTEAELELKVGAQIMFVKNDTVYGRYYNGQLGKIAGYDSGEEIFRIALPDGTVHSIGKETWRNVRYRVAEGSDRLVEDEIGSFQQYPLRLAWAITIHKSQGLTFDQLAIDASSSFAPGQVYVALSRCTSLEGLMLLQPLPRQSIMVDARIVQFSARESHTEWLKEQLPLLKKAYADTALLNSFSLYELEEAIETFVKKAERLSPPDAYDPSVLLTQLPRQLGPLNHVMQRFQQQLSGLLNEADELQIKERIAKSILYFGEQLHVQFYKPVHAYLKLLVQSGAKVRQLTALTGDLLNAIISTARHFYELPWGDHQWTDIEKPQWIQGSTAGGSLAPKEKLPAPKKGDSRAATLEWFEKGKTPQEIADLRTLSVSTIEGHLAGFVAEGTISVLELLDPKLYRQISLAIPKAEDPHVASSVKKVLPEEISYGQIRLAMAGYQFSQKNAGSTVAT